VIVRRDQIEVEAQNDPTREEPASASKLVIPFSPVIGAPTGITREPPHNNGRIDALAREKLLNAIGRATRWVKALKSREAKSFEEIAVQEGICVRHVRRLSVLAFVSPNLLNAVVSCTAPNELTASVLTEALPKCWAKQEAFFGVISPNSGA
jgi:hypothetical protein